MRIHNWKKLNDENWEKINKELEKDYKDKEKKIITMTPDQQMKYMEKRFKKIRSKWCKPVWIRENTQMFYDNQLNNLKNTWKKLRRKIAKLKKKEQKCSRCNIEVV